MNRVVEWLRALAGKVVVPRMEAKLRAFDARMHDAAAVQRQVLFDKLAYCAESDFGREHGFGRIRTVADFRRQVPIADFDYYRPYMDRVARGEVEAVFPRGEKLLMFTLTSGSTAAPKIIPINRRWMEEYRAGFQIWGVKAFLDHPECFYGKVTGMAGNWDIQRTPSGVSCGMASGLASRMQSPLMRMMYCVPPAVFEIDDVHAKYYAALRLAVAQQSKLFVTATPTTVVQFAQLGDTFRDTLIRDIHDGTMCADFELPEDVRGPLKLTPDPQRAAELEGIVERTGHLYPKDYWNLALIGCWLGGTVGTYASRIADYYGDVPRRDIGLLCSEGRFTLPMADETPAGPLEIASHYYEFVPVAQYGAADPDVLECHELAEGQEYYILLTTSSGLYRYDIQDVLRCVGFVGQTPILEFLNKGSRFADMEGEKVSENSLAEGVVGVCGEIGSPVQTFTAVPLRPEDDVPLSAAGKPYYVFLVEEGQLPGDAAGTFLRGIDAWLRRVNVMYEGKRADLYLDPPRLMRIPAGAFGEYDRAEIARRGSAEDHYKHPCLVLDAAFLRRFEMLEEVR